jgi:hypothetical protein
MAADAASCPHCGAANMEERCPHCGAVTTASPDAELRWRCDLCGGPRMPRPDPAVPRVRREIAHPKEANRARTARAKSRALMAAFGVIGLVSTLFFALWSLIFTVWPVVLVWGLFAGTALFVVLWAMGRAGAATKALKAAVDRAWLAAAEAVAARLPGPFSAAKLGKALGVESAQAEELLALLEAHDVVRSDVTDAGEIAYQTKLRVGDVDLSSPEAEVEALAEAEAMAAEERRAKASK